MVDETKTNTVTVNGTICSKLRFTNEIYGEKFYTTHLKAERASGCDDIVPIIISDRMLRPSEDYFNKNIHVEGELRSYDLHVKNKTKLVVSVFATSIMLLKNEILPSENSVNISGYVCREPVFRLTPKGREITDLLIAVTRRYNKSDYIPCVCWGRNARFASQFLVGNFVRLLGRFQSRTYEKNINGKIQTFNTYEVSISSIQKI